MTETSAPATQAEMFTQFQELLNSRWTTRDLIGFAAFWCDYDSGLTPIAKRICGTPRESYQWYSEMDPEEARELAIDALVSSGWTLRRINCRKS